MSSGKPTNNFLVCCYFKLGAPLRGADCGGWRYA